MNDPTPCPRCGEVPHEPANRFCTRCGAPLGALPTTLADSSIPGSGPRCAAHPDRPAAEVCARCGNFACGPCVAPDYRGRPMCAACRGLARETGWQVPWEDRARLGLLAAFWQTARATMFTPGLCYPGLGPRTGKLWDPLSYALFAGCVAILAALAVFGAAGAAIALVIGGRTAAQPIGIAAAVAAGIAAAMPLLVLARIFLLAGAEHLGLLALGASGSGFEATLRAHCYSAGPSVLLVVPFCGPYAAEIWQAVLRVMAYRHVHRTTVGRAILAVIAPIGICCGLYFALLVGLQIAAAGLR